MSPKPRPSRLNQLLYRLRMPLAAAALLFILYCAAYLWHFVPYEDFTYAWRPDAHLVVIGVPSGSLAAPYLRPGDEVLEIGGRPIRRMQPVYPLPLQAAYEYNVLREGEVLTFTVPFSRRVTPLAIELRLPPTILALAGWIVGAIMLFWARADNWQALRAGFIFLFGAMAVIGVYAAMNGVPGAWVMGYALLFFLAPAWAYLGLLPRAALMSPRTCAVHRLLFALAGGLVLVAAYEVLALYPQSTSMEELVGVSMYGLGFLLAGLGLLACVAILAGRALRMPPLSYLRRQIVILLAFIGLGTLPIVLLSIIPSTLFDVGLLPFPVAISLMLLIPAGYLFVIYRRGFLGLDLFFSRSLHLILLSLIVFGFYAGALYLVQKLLRLGSAEAIVPASLVFFPTLLFTIYMNKPILGFVEHLVYGDVAYSQNALAEFASALSSRPETGTLEAIAASLAGLLNCGRAMLALKDESGRLAPVSVVGDAAVPDAVPADLHELSRPFLHAAADDTQAATHGFRCFPWAEILVPVRVRDEQVGLLALSRPEPDGYFNTRQVSFLTQAAGVLAVGAENIFLFNTARRQARQIMFVQEEERKSLSRQLHDDPLQRVTYAINVIDQVLTRGLPAGSENGEVATRLATAADHLREAAMGLRNVCIGLYPPFRDQAVELTVREIVRQFAEEYGLNIEVAIETNGATTTVSEEVTMAVGRVLIEALNNVVKHALAANGWVTLRYGGEGELELAVTDNGPGSPALRLSYSELIRRGHLGIVGMHEWARQIGGELTIRPNEPSGTMVLLHCPTT
ncbi:MAG: ATP-binding protein [Candidatus Promineifilaceae bacterium]